MTAIQLGTFTLGEIPAPLEYQFLTFTGTAINLTGYAVEFAVKERLGEPDVHTGTLSTDGTDGKVLYTWTGTEWPTPGMYKAQFWAGNGTNRFASNVIEWCVRASIGVVPEI